MTNIVSIDKSRGFTRMDNDLYEALIGADLSGRELRVALAIHRQTAGYNVDTARIAASVIADMSGIRREHVSRMISELLRQRVLYRLGGSKGPLGISPANEWKIDSKEQVKSKEPQKAQCAVFGTSLVPFPAHYKDRNTNTTSDEVVGDSVSIEQATPEKPKAERKPAFGKAQMLAENPHGLEESLITDYLAVRKAKRAPVSARVWSKLNTKLGQCAAFGVSASQALEIAIENGWQGFEVEWIANRKASKTNAAPTSSSRHTGFSERDYTAGLIQREDGSYVL